MIPQFDHHVVNSFMLWADHYLIDRAKAFKTVTTQLYPMGKDSQNPDLFAYASPFKQWIADTSIAGVTVPKITDILLDGVPLQAFSEGGVDFENGRILCPEDFGDAILTATYSVKDVNLYCPNENEEDVIFENRYLDNSRFKVEEAGVQPYEPAFPAIFFSIQSGDNEPFAFGGEDQTTLYVKGVVMTDDLFILEGVLSSYRDSNQKVFKLIPFEQNPFNEYGDVKSGTTYNYNNLSDAQNSLIFYIDKVKTAKLTEKSKSRATKDLFIGFVDFTILAHRYPRA